MASPKKVVALVGNAMGNATTSHREALENTSFLRRSEREKGFEPSTSTLARAPDAPQSESVRDLASSDHTAATDRDPPCFTVRQDDSSGNVTETHAGRTCSSAATESRPPEQA